MKLDLSKFPFQNFQDLDIDDESRYYTIIVSPVLYDTEHQKCLKDALVFCFLIKLQLDQWNEGTTFTMALPKAISEINTSIGLAKVQGVMSGETIKKKMTKTGTKARGCILQLPKTTFFTITQTIFEIFSKSGKTR